MTRRAQEQEANLLGWHLIWLWQIPADVAFVVDRLSHRLACCLLALRRCSRRVQGFATGAMTGTCPMWKLKSCREEPEQVFHRLMVLAGSELNLLARTKEADRSELCVTPELWEPKLQSRPAIWRDSCHLFRTKRQS